MDKDGDQTSVAEQATKTSAPLSKGYDIQIEVDDNDIISFTGRINPRHYAGKPVQQIWSAFYNTARQVTEAWEAHYNE